MSIQDLDVRRLPQPLSTSHGHPHFWARALSRRAFLAGTSIGLGGAALVASGVPLSALAAGTAGAPTPIPGTLDLFGTHFHLNFFGQGDFSTVFDFNGQVAATHTIGAGKGPFSDLTFDVDMRVMKGEYIDQAGTHRNASFGFV